jgi:hypothetical protein
MQSEEDKTKHVFKIDKQSSARIIKHSLWQNAHNKSSKTINDSLNLLSTDIANNCNKREAENFDNSLNKKLKLD